MTSQAAAVPRVGRERPPFPGRRCLTPKQPTRRACAAPWDRVRTRAHREAVGHSMPSALRTCSYGSRLDTSTTGADRSDASSARRAVSSCAASRVSRCPCVRASARARIDAATSSIKALRRQQPCREPKSGVQGSETRGQGEPKRIAGRTPEILSVARRSVFRALYCARRNSEGPI